MITFRQFISEIKKIVKLNAGELRKEAEAAGHRLFDSHRSGLIFDGDIEIMAVEEYGTSYDTFDYLFRPPKDVADGKVKKEHAIEEAYSCDETSWVVVPHEVDIKDIRANAIQLPQVKKRIRESAEDDFLFGDCASTL